GLTRPTWSSTISRARCIRRLVARWLAARFWLRLVQCIFGFSMDCFGGFFCFVAYSLSGFLRLSADGLSSLFRFLSDCFCGFLGFLACSFKSVLDRLSCFLGSMLYVLQCFFLPERGESRSRHQRNNKARYFHECLLYLLFPVQVERTKRPYCVHPTQPNVNCVNLF